METGVRAAILAMWLGWIAYWLVAARDVKRNRWQESPAARALHSVPLLLSTVLLAAPHWLPRALTARLAPPGPALPLAGAVLVAFGLGVSVWARVHLGRNWSSQVVVKQDHALVRGGPYRAVRHPIYSGLLLAILGTAAAIGEWRGLAALACALAGILVRVRAEEAQMRRIFPEYAGYVRQSWALIPGIY
jgi:protein-S-isoprenylcysteine O-methyltransferase Ste14